MLLLQNGVIQPMRIKYLIDYKIQVEFRIQNFYSQALKYSLMIQAKVFMIPDSYDPVGAGLMLFSNDSRVLVVTGS